MPTYEYACRDCGTDIEVVQKMSDPPLTVCAVCGGELRRVYSPVGIVFKGSGFYKTDSRSASRKGEKAGVVTGGDGAGGKEAGDTDGATSRGAAKEGAGAGSSGESGGSQSGGSTAGAKKSAKPAAKPA